MHKDTVVYRKKETKKAHCVITGLTGLDTRHIGHWSVITGGGENADVLSSNWKVVYSNYVQMGAADWVNESLRVPFPVHSCKTLTAPLSCFPANSYRIIVLTRTFVQESVSLDALK